jgi:uncharacterized circularly permuted ATP-grasp superfamily protein
VDFESYALDDSSYDEKFAASGNVGPLYPALVQRMSELSQNEFQSRQRTVDLLLRNQGVTFTVYSDSGGIDPFDPILRLISAEDWSVVERSLIQRTEALNLYLHDIYGAQHILDDRVIDPELIYGAGFYRREMVGFTPPGGIYTHVVGTDLIRDKDGSVLLLEDNARNPSGVSYVLGCREVLKRVFRVLFEEYGFSSVAHPGQ